MAAKPDPRTDPDVPAGMSIDLLKDLHLLTRDGQLNADARRKLKQIRHLVGLLRPAVDDALARHPDARIVDCGAGKSYLGALLYELVLGPAGRVTVLTTQVTDSVSLQTSATAGFTGKQPYSWNLEDCAAFAFNFPHAVAGLRIDADEFQDFEAVKLLADDDFRFHLAPLCAVCGTL